jgi:cytidylate kinase
VILEGENVTQVIRTEKIGNAASMISVLPAVRAALLSRQRAFRATPGLIAEGRDMGTVVFPDAELKIFLQASLEERALRRYGQLKSKGLDVTLSAIMEDLCMRDKRDQERAVAPLKPAIGAVCINTDHLSIEQVIEKVLLEIKRKKAFPAISNLMTGSARVGVAE